MVLLEMAALVLLKLDVSLVSQVGQLVAQVLCMMMLKVVVIPAVPQEKAKKGTTAEEVPTPRTRAAIAREAAAKAKRESLEVELKAAAAREAAQAAAREEVDAARNEFLATQAHEQVMEVMTLEVQLPKTTIQTTTARRYCSSSTDSMIMDYLCNKSIINQTLFSIGPYLLKMHWRLKCSQLGR